MLLKFSQNSLENTFVIRDSDTVFSCEFCEIFENTFGGCLCVSNGMQIGANFSQSRPVWLYEKFALNAYSFTGSLTLVPLNISIRFLETRYVSLIFEEQL